MIEFGPRLISREDEDVSQAVAGFLKEEGIDVRVNSKMIGVEKQRNSIAAKIESAGGIHRLLELICWLRPVGDRTLTTLASTRRVSPATRAGISWWTTNCAPTFPVSGQWATAMAAARSRTRRGMISRSWRRIFSTTIRDE